MPTPALQFGAGGIASVKLDGQEYLSSGEVALSAVRFESSGITNPADLVHSTSVDESQKQILQTYSWGQVLLSYSSGSARVTISATISNRSATRITGFSLRLLSLKLPAKPREFDGRTPIVGHNIGSPTVLPLSWNSGMLVAVNDDSIRPLLFGFPRSLDVPSNQIYPVIMETGKSNLSESLPFIDRSIAPQSSDQFSISLRFAADKTPLQEIAPDVYQSFADANPFRFGWSDRRPIGSIFLSTSAAGWPSNPRGWFLDPAVDVLTPEGRAQFRRRVLAFADDSINELREMNAQGVIVWDIEGQEFAHPVSYIGDPGQVTTLAPEMDAIADEFFAKLRNAGLRVGVTIRPQIFVAANSSRPASQLDQPDPQASLTKKIEYAAQRWGASLFYIDSNGDPAFPLDSNILLNVSQAFPDSLLIPEHENFRHFTFSAPYNELRGGIASTPGPVRSTYPTAFSVINIADGALNNRSAEIIEAIKGGDIFMFRGWYPDPSNKALKDLYRFLPDNVLPQISLLDFEEGRRATGTVELRADATDNTGLARVRFQVDGIDIETRDLPYPYTIAWNSASASNGPHTVTAVAHDLAGNRSLASATIEVENEKAPVCPDIASGQFASCYFSDRNMTQLALVGLDNLIAFDRTAEFPLKEISPDGFSAVWQGSFSFERAVYSFQPKFTGVASLFIDGQLAWSSEDPIPAFLKQLQAGSHLIRVVYSGPAEGASARLFWTPTGSQR